MKNPNLLTRTSYTFFNSLLKVDDIIKLSKDNNFSNAFLIDRNIMYGSMEFYLKCIKNNLKPIIGLEVDYGNHKSILIAKNIKGYKELISISSKINLNKDIDISNLNQEDIYTFKGLISPVLYKNPEDIEALKNFNSISNSEDFFEASSHFMDREEFLQVYNQEILNEIDNLIDDVDLVIEEQKNVLPSFFHNGEKVNSKEFLENKLKLSLQKLLNNDKSLDRQKYIERVSYELKTISKMGFESYFLIVADIVQWSKEQGIFVGPGRGSAPGSMISFLLNITTIDPIENDLLFERFLNPDRVSMPDIDIDFEDTRRDEVIEYIADRYGRENV